MKMTSLWLHSIGRHDGLVLERLGQGLTVVHGPNEAGKSTILAAVRGLVFGKLMSSEHQIDTPRGAMGRMQLVTESGAEVFLERALHRKSPPKVTDETGVIHTGQEALKTLFPELSAVEDLVYQSVFTFQLAELTDFADSDGNLQSKVYAVGAPGGVIPIELEQRFAALGKSLFNPDKRAKNAKLNQCLQKLGALRAERRAAADVPEAYQRALEALADRQAAQAEASRRLEEIRQRLHQLYKLTEALPIHQALVAIEEAQSDTDPGVNLPINKRTSIERLQERIAQTQVQADEWKSKRDTLEHLAAGISIDDTVLQSVHRHRQLYSEASGVLTTCEHLDARKQEMAALSQRVRDLRARLGSVWTDAFLDDVGAVARLEDLRNQGEQRLDAAMREVEAASGAVYAQGRAVQERRSDWERVCHQSFGEVLSPSALAARAGESAQRWEDLTHDEERATDLDRLLHEISGLDAEHAELAAIPNQSGHGRREKGAVPAALLLLFAATVASTWFASRSLPIVVAAGAVTFGLTLYLYLQARDRAHIPSAEAVRVQRRLAKLTEERAQVRSAITTLTGAFVSVRPNAEGLTGSDEIMRKLRAERRVCQQQRAIVDRLEHSLRAWQEAEQELERQQIWHQQAAQRQAAALSRWLADIREEGLAIGDITPTAFREQLRQVEEHRAVRRQLADFEREVETATNAVREYVAAVCSVLPTAYSETAATGDGVAAADDTPQALRHLISVLKDVCEYGEVQVESAARKTDIRRQWAQCGEALDKALGQKAELERELRVMYDELGVVDAAEYQDLVFRVERHDNLSVRARELRYQLFGMFGSEQAYGHHIEALHDASVESLQADIEAYQEEEQAARADHETSGRAVVELQMQLRTWKDGPSATQLEWDIARAEDERQDLALRYATYTVAANLVRRVRESYERTHRSRTLVTASDMFRSMTHGKYQSLSARYEGGGAHHLYCIDTTGREWPAHVLSRGTREQIYLSLRLAMVMEYAENGIRLPVILDDPLVNFDAHRLQAAFEKIRMLGEHTQVIYLTCHPHVVQMAGQCKDADVVRL